MIKEQLKERATTLVQIPDHFQPVIEEYFEGENGEGEAMFTWTDEQRDEGISITLDLAGNLTSLSIELNKTNTDSISLSEVELKEQAEGFLLSHYPHALQHLTYCQTKKLTNATRFYYEQFVMELPLPNAGSYIDVEPSGEIVNFKYSGIHPTPIIPKTLIAKEKLMENVQNRLDFQLTITNVNSVIYDVTEDGLRLLYDLELFMKYKAGATRPTLTIIHDEDEDYLEKYVSLPPPVVAIHKDISIEEIIGITEEMEVIREVEWGEETGIVWRERDWTMEENDLSVDHFFQRQNEDTVKAFISKKTGKVSRFMWFKERSGDLCLNREQCYQKAIEFLQMIIPNYDQYLQLIVRDNDDELDETSTKETFTFHVHNGQGIRIYLEIVVVSVNKQTGQINYYSGPSFDFEQLKHISSEPVISKEDAHDIFLNHLDFELVWNKSYEENEEVYTLVYQACDRQTRKSIRYIDAITGAVITEKD